MENWTTTNYNLKLDGGESINVAYKISPDQPPSFSLTTLAPRTIPTSVNNIPDLKPLIEFLQKIAARHPA